MSVDIGFKLIGQVTGYNGSLIIDNRHPAKIAVFVVQKSFLKRFIFVEPAVVQVL